ncbi:TRAP transporter large permease [Chelatococcus asaccharovorans]|uniref:TRAP transporter large permease protein n=1 Tax=Chelatococcus asaccharovorans TaxID=28210 RepID=A0A2V3UH00_9HYPH|nr:TRAP transporter large permease subunit [Chelatococcus asaccharovorans]MBS7701753.1 TRAP transporter large permease subunit [Chelatococcus asaccharovorans]PXW64541.1 C4-dicarboxylate transporter DctM subunit [Chelatococcus asaccharovorans]
MSALLLLTLVLGLLALRQNIIVVLLAAAGYVHFVWGDGNLEYLAEDLWISLDNALLLAIPMFLLAGNIMTRGSIARRLIDLAIAVTRPIPGGLAVATILSCAIFAAISGSSPVTLLAVGTILYPALIENGYGKRFALGALTSGGTLGIIIPPSIPLILYGVVTETSISDLFVAGIVPGILIASVLALYSWWTNRHLPAQNFDISEFAGALRKGAWAMLLPVILLGGIYTGYFSATEAAAVALFYALFVEIVIHRELKPIDFFDTAVDTAKLLGMLFPIVAVALSLKTILTIEEIPDQLALWISTIATSKIVFLLMVTVFLLIVGCMFDVISAILILAPLLLIPAMGYGINPVHFGIIMVINLEIGFLTPPVGLNLIVAMTAFRESFGEICRAVLPFIVLILGVLLLVTFVPQTALFFLK